MLAGQAMRPNTFGCHGRGAVDLAISFSMAIRAKDTERHDYAATLVWTGAKAGPTSSYPAYSREYEYRCGDKAPMRGSADPG